MSLRNEDGAEPGSHRASRNFVNQVLPQSHLASIRNGRRSSTKHSGMSATLRPTGKPRRSR